MRNPNRQLAEVEVERVEPHWAYVRIARRLDPAFRGPPSALRRGIDISHKAQVGDYGVLWYIVGPTYGLQQVILIHRD